MMPGLFFSIGTEDFGYEAWCEWKKHAEEIGLEAEFHTGPGVHEWRVWERDIRPALKSFIPESKVMGNAC